MSLERALRNWGSISKNEVWHLWMCPSQIHRPNNDFSLMQKIHKFFEDSLSKIWCRPKILQQKGQGNLI